MKKTKEELLKIYSAYLPYELKCLIQGHNNQDGKAIKETMLGIYDGTEIFTSLGSKDYQTNEIEDVFPILYSMDMLTKEIEHKGERFIPIEKLFDIETGLNWSSSDYIKSEKGKNEYWTRSKESGKSFYFGFNSERNYFYHIDSSGFQQSVKNQLEMFQKLFEWHLNVFGLDESEYIKKEYLNRSENPNS